MTEGHSLAFHYCSWTKLWHHNRCLIHVGGLREEQGRLHVCVCYVHGREEGTSRGHWAADRHCLLLAVEQSADVWVTLEPEGLITCWTRVLSLRIRWHLLGMFETQLFIPCHLSTEVPICQCRSLVRFLVFLVAHLASIEHLPLCLSCYSWLSTIHINSTVHSVFIQAWGVYIGPWRHFPLLRCKGLLWKTVTHSRRDNLTFSASSYSSDRLLITRQFQLQSKLLSLSHRSLFLPWMIPVESTIFSFHFTSRIRCNLAIGVPATQRR